MLTKLDGTQIVHIAVTFFIFFIRKGMVMSGINDVRTSVRFAALIVEKRRVVGWYAKINE